MQLVGKFLQIVFTNHSLPKRCGQNLSPPSSVHSFPETTQLLHYCPGCSQAQLIHLIISIYDGVPESFEVFRCHSSSSKEELSLFLKRMAKHPLQYLILEINQLSFKLQEVSSWCVALRSYLLLCTSLIWVSSPLSPSSHDFPLSLHPFSSVSHSGEGGRNVLGHLHSLCWDSPICSEGDALGCA